MNNIAIYAGTFDPITKGHMDIILRGAQIFDQIVVAIADSGRKKTFFTLSERVQLVERVFSGQKNISAAGFQGLLVDFAEQQGANILLRGMRTVADFDYEFQLNRMNQKMSPKIETLFLLPAEQHRYISSSLVKEIASFQRDVSDFVAPPVADALKEKYS